ncbi:MAG: signal peptidase II [Rhodospirillales bacterium]|nr:signal peptidase II [Rhodospirillales bacterium]
MSSTVWRLPVSSGLRFGLPLAAAIVLADQITKWWVVEHLMRPPGVEQTPFHTFYSIPVTPFLSLVMAWNRGVSFGIFDNDGAYNAVLLSALALIIVIVLAVWLHRAEDRLLRMSLGFIIGGALGNVIDRVRFGAVADFIYLHAGHFDWPAFNLADSAITVGAVLLVADALFGRRNSHKNSP